MKATRITGCFAALILALTVTGCGGGGSSPEPTPEPTPTSLKGGTTFNQTLTAVDQLSIPHPFPGQPNIWDLDLDFSLGDGGDDQFDGGLQLAVNGNPFLADQTYDELTFSEPYLSAADGVKVAAVADGSYGTPLQGVWSAWLGGIYDARLQQIVDLTGSGAPIDLCWSDDVRIDPGYFAQGNDPYYRVVIRDISGTLLEIIYAEPYPYPASFIRETNHTVPIDQYAGQEIVLSFEQRGSNLDDLSQTIAVGYAQIDEVSISDNLGEVLVNGGFESGDLTGWTTNTPQELQNITSGSRTLANLRVTRSFFTVPNRLWGRWVDVFENPTVNPATVTVTYNTNLGHDNGDDGFGTGMIDYTPGTKRALSSWDNLAGDRDRDLGLVFGSGASVLFDDPSAVDLADGNDLITVTFNITVPALGRKSLVNFVVMNGIDTGEIPGASASTRPGEIDAENILIFEGYGIDPQYQEGMTREQIESVVNF